MSLDCNGREAIQPEEIVAKLRQVDVLVSQGARTHSPVVQGGCWAEPPIMAGKSRQRASESPRSQGSPSSTSSSRGDRRSVLAALRVNRRGARRGSSACGNKTACAAI